MSRIEQRFASLRSRGRKALIPFITAGDPAPAHTLGLMHALVKGGADIIELGVPFSDPMADGPVIQRASERALEHHVGMGDVLDMVKAFREDDTETPVVLMGYLNPIEVMGYDAFARAAVAAGVDGVLTVDCPPEEGGGYLDALRGVGLDTVFLVAPTSHEARIRRISAASSGFVYYVSLKGVTGAGHLDIGSVRDKVTEIRAHTDLPVGVGFGIKDADTAARMAEIADAVVVGSAIVSRVETNADRPQDVAAELTAFVAGLRAAMDAAAQAA
ncbi:MAG: tryptophan synthase subunit alpha [Pseudomonadota bacterium]